jgi:hypothetical protein
MTDQRRNDLPEIKQLLIANVAALAAKLCPGGHRSGKYWMGSSMVHTDKPNTFWIEITGRPGAWCDPVADKKGDILDLIAYRACGADRFRDRASDVLMFARDFLGHDKMKPEERQRMAQSAQREVAMGDAARVAELEKNRRRALAVWLDSKKHPFIDSLADTYLRERAIDVRRLTRMPSALGFLPAAFHSDSNSSWPCMVAGMSDDAGNIVAIHRTFLDRDGQSKAPVEPQRKIWPAFKGCAMRMWRGETKLSPAEAAKHGLLDTMVLCEGVEDALSIALGAPQFRVWAVGALGNLQAIKLPACSRDVIVWADNDWSKRQAASQLDKGVEALAAQGAKVSVARAHVGKDANDLLRSA